MKNLENFGVQELNATELISIEGGRRGIWRAIERLSALIGLTEAMDEFSAGFNSVEC